ncbi:hypothetical protein LIER_11153 [Lithospermum erythrorhizon]|uniref:RRM domain-containing protein n=1 Tax=Lithospermum erythrorhizon TaxID=34254 RepID=A0AAV3PPU7_LITER
MLSHPPYINTSTPPSLLSLYQKSARKTLSPHLQNLNIFFTKMVSSASSLNFLSLTPQTLYSSKPNTPLSTLSLPFSFSALKLTTPLTMKPFLESRLVRNVAVSSEFNPVEQDAEGGIFYEEGAEVASFSPDLQIFVGNLPFSVDSSALAGLFGRAGTVEMVEVIYDKVTGRSRGFGFVTMSSVEEVQAAVQQFNGYELDGRELRVNSGPPPPKRDNFASRDFSSGGSRGSSGGFNSDNRVYVGNLSWGVDDLALQNLFREQGKVMEARVVYDRESGRSRGFGFVTFSSPEEVNSAVEALDGTDLDGRTIRVSPAEARQRRQF